MVNMADAMNSGSNLKVRAFLLLKLLGNSAVRQDQLTERSELSQPFQID